MNELALFAGAGGGILGSHLLGCKTICAVERDAYAAQVLAQRQNDGILAPFPIWSDIKSFDGKPWRGIVDVISGGFPCQDISSAGKGKGIDGERSGLWSEMARIISEVRPREVWVENSPMLVSRGLTRVISDLAQMGYDAHWARFSASNFGAPHIRDRVWIVAYANSTADGQQYQYESKRNYSQRSLSNVANSKSNRFESQGLQIGKKSEKPKFGVNSEYVANTQSIGLEQKREYQLSSEKWFTWSSCEFSNADCFRCRQMGQRVIIRKKSKRPSDTSQHGCFSTRGKWWSVEPELGRVADGVAHRVDRLKAIGNGQVPVVAKSAFEFLGVGL
ncbi:DNA cytosine methyltransferase [Acinetobacter sp. Tr-809]|uniref:DNA cytosine methyltransferase n=1 Tax=Acinetobacter sp. Tr-809 TaxID=2608324 RepID=UPI00141F648C|nr:DNA cytosine methyltransferase [Acinetobacter sp. Tr-809]NIE95631.1 DNA cytosine methyltransferase [Acinetobacter sp. Tr-809]